jgi:hypothetical protein
MEKSLNDIFDTDKETIATQEASISINDHWTAFAMSTNLLKPEFPQIQVENLRFAFLAGADATRQIIHTATAYEQDEAGLVALQTALEEITQSFDEQVVVLGQVVKAFLESRITPESEQSKTRQ